MNGIEANLQDLPDFARLNRGYVMFSTRRRMVVIFFY